MILLLILVAITHSHHVMLELVRHGWDCTLLRHPHEYRCVLHTGVIHFPPLPLPRSPFPVT